MTATKPTAPDRPPIASAPPARQWSISVQIAEVKRDLAMRRSVYPRSVAAGKMAQRDADNLISVMANVLRTLEWVRDNADDLRRRQQPVDAEGAE